MKPVAFGKMHGNRYIVIGVHDLNNNQPVHVREAWKGADELYAADQLRAAQIAILREAATDFRYSNGTEAADNYLLRMADELEKQK